MVLQKEKLTSQEIIQEFSTQLEDLKQKQILSKQDKDFLFHWLNFLEDKVEDPTQRQILN
jgi:hypothetical protein